MVAPQCFHHRGKIYRALPNGTVGISSAVIIVDMHMGKPGLQELRQAVIDVCMAGIEGKPASFNTVEICRSAKVEKIHVPHVLEPESEREFTCGVAKLMQGLFELPVGLHTLLFPGKISRVHDDTCTNLSCNRKAIGHDLYACRADGFKERGYVHPVVGCMENKICRITPEQRGIMHKVGAFGPHLHQ